MLQRGKRLKITGTIITTLFSTVYSLGCSNMCVIVRCMCTCVSTFFKKYCLNYELFSWFIIKLRNNPQIRNVSQVWCAYIRTHPNNIFTSSTFRSFHKTAGLQVSHHFHVSKRGGESVMDFFQVALERSSESLPQLAGQSSLIRQFGETRCSSCNTDHILLDHVFGCVTMDTMLITLKSECILWHRMHKSRTFHLIVSQTLI